MPMLRLIGSACLNVAVYGVLLFTPAGTLRWWRAWALLGAALLSMIASRLLLLREADALLAERSKPPLQHGQPLADKLLTVAFLTTFPGYIAFIPLDAFHLHLFPKPGIAISVFGLLLSLTGWIVMSFAFRDNPFAVAIVRHQDERGHIVVDRGVYAIVRHPLYMGVVFTIVGVALWLQSYAAAMVAVIPIGVLIIRIVVEESFLKLRLVGYDAYTKRVRSRLIPHVW